MAVALPYIAVALAGVSAVQQVEAAGDAKRAARANARALEAETAEEARRLKKEQASQESKSRALAAASGGGGQSQTSFMESQKKEHANELDWLKRSGSSRASSARAGGSLAAKQGYAGAVGTVASAVSGFGG